MSPLENLTEKAADLRKLNPALSEVQAFARVFADPANADVVSSLNPLEGMVCEARELAADERVAKSESGRLLTALITRICETLATGTATTGVPPRHHS